MLKKRLGKAIVQASKDIGLLSAYRSIRSRLVPQQVAILAYHRIDRATNYPWSGTPVAPEVFELEMKYLRQRYRIISLEDLGTTLIESKPLPPSTAVVTVDDGYRDAYLNAYPILKKYGIPATVFLATGYIGTGDLFWCDKVWYIIWKTGLTTLDLGERGTYHLNSSESRRKASNRIIARLKTLPSQDRNEFLRELTRLCGVDIPPALGKEYVLSWEEIREMSRNGVSFGAHSVTHPSLTSLPLEAAANEVLDSKRRIENEIGREVTTFCYPFGEPGDLNEEIEKILINSGFKCAVKLIPIAFTSPTSPPYRLPRILAPSSIESFQLLLSGLLFDLAARHSQGQKRS
jgi:peptidoglycan/xylan/chitin deacetylase (PgdA/CDA1 family)